MVKARDILLWGIVSNLNLILSRIRPPRKVTPPPTITFKWRWHWRPPWTIRCDCRYKQPEIGLGITIGLNGYIEAEPITDLTGCQVIMEYMGSSGPPRPRPPKGFSKPPEPGPGLGMILAEVFNILADPWSRTVYYYRAAPIDLSHGRVKVCLHRPPPEGVEYAVNLSYAFTVPDFVVPDDYGLQFINPLLTDEEVTWRSLFSVDGTASWLVDKYTLPLGYFYRLKVMHGWRQTTEWARGLFRDVKPEFLVKPEACNAWAWKPIITPGETRLRRGTYYVRVQLVDREWGRTLEEYEYALYAGPEYEAEDKYIEFEFCVPITYETAVKRPTFKAYVYKVV